MAASLTLAGCGGQTPEEKASADARAVAQVEAAQRLKPPIEPLEVGAINPTVRRVFNLSERGCAFFTDDNPGAFPLAVIGSDKAVFQINGEPAIFAADSGSREVIGGIRQRYAGRQHIAKIAQEPDRVTISDAYDRIVYQAVGTLRCSAPDATPQPVVAAAR